MKSRLTGRARRELAAALAVSRVQFGRSAQVRYRALLEQPIVDVADDPDRPGVTMPDEADDLRLYQVRHSRSRMDADRVSRPRHVLAFRVRADRVEVISVLHDAMDLPAHLRDL